MADFIKGYDSVVTAPIGSGAENLIGTNTGICDIAATNAIVELDPEFSNNLFPTGTTFTAIQVTFTAQTTTSATSTLRVTPKIGAISSGHQDFDINAGSSFVTNQGLFGLSPTVNSMQFLTVQFKLITPNSTTTRIIKSFAGGTPKIKISYTLPFSNKVYNTSGALEITSGKTSIT